MSLILLFKQLESSNLTICQQGCIELCQALPHPSQWPISWFHSQSNLMDIVDQWFERLAQNPSFASPSFIIEQRQVYSKITPDIWKKILYYTRLYAFYLISVDQPHNPHTFPSFSYRLFEMYISIGLQDMLQV